MSPANGHPEARTSAQATCPCRSHDATTRFSRPLLVAAAGVLLVIWYVLIVLGRPLSHDEHMYIAAGALLRDRVLYKDFAYLQTPYLPYVYRGLFALLPAADWWLAARLVSLAAGIVAIGCVWRIGRKASASPAVAVLAAGLFATHHLTLFVMPLARNHLPALACVLAAYGCWLSATYSPRASRWNFAAGILGGCAIGLKLTSAPMVIALLGLSFWNNAASKSFRPAALAFSSQLLGIALALAPACIILRAADWEVVRFDNYGYHQVNAKCRAAMGEITALGFDRKLRSAGEFIIRGSGACTLVVLVLGLGVALSKESPPPSDPVRKTILVSAWIMLAAALFAALAPTPLQRDYLVPASAFLVILISAYFPHQRFECISRLRHLAYGFTVISVLVAVITSARHIRHVFDNRNLTPLTLKRITHEIAGTLQNQTHSPPRLVTLAPIIPLAAGLEIYPELATGPFLYRVGDEISPATLNRCGGMSASQLESLLDRWPPDGVLIGYEPDLDEPLRQYAETHNYTQAPETIAGGQLYVRPATPE